MDRQTTLALIIAVAVLMVLVAFVGGDRVSGRTVAELRAEVANVEDARAQFVASERDALSGLESDPELFAAEGLEARWRGLLSEAKSGLAEAGEQATAAQTLLESGEFEDEEQIREAVARARQARLSALAVASEVREGVEQRLAFKRDFAASVEAMEADFRAIEAASLEPIEDVIRRAVADWPEKAADLNARLEAVREEKAGATDIWSEVTRLREKSIDAMTADEIDTVISAAQSLATRREALESARATVPAWVDELYWSWDRILADLAMRGNPPRHYQVLKTIRTRVDPSATPSRESSATAEPAGAAAGAAPAGTAEVKEESSESQVSRSKFESLEKYLGMTLETKAAGKFDREAERQVQPPGYAYIASPSEGKNRYGYWENRNGSSFWVFYGRYALMRDLFWGHGNSGWLNERSYRDFDNHRRSGRVYYDKSTTGGQRFGKGGTFTNSRYSGSEYVRSGGYREFRERAQRRSTRYSGSRYSSRSTRSSPRSTSFGSSRGRSFGGSRFGGGK